MSEISAALTDGLYDHRSSVVNSAIWNDVGSLIEYLSPEVLRPKCINDLESGHSYVLTLVPVLTLRCVER
jgi:hypothetical protein